MLVLLPLASEQTTYDTDNLLQRVKMLIASKASTTVRTPLENDNLFHLCIKLNEYGKNYRADHRQDYERTFDFLFNKLDHQLLESASTDNLTPYKLI